MAKLMNKQPSSILSEIPRETLKRALVTWSFWAFVSLTTFLFYLRPAMRDALWGGPTTVDIHVTLLGVASPGDRIEVSPLQGTHSLSSHNDLWCRDVDFANVRNRRLEILRVDKTSRTTLADIEIGNKPVVDIHVERTNP